MTYGLVLSAEAARARYAGDAESRRRVRKATRWLLDNSDLDNDGLPGWGLPQAWDAWSDGTTNPRNHPYTITTAIVLGGLLDALAIPEFWTAAEQEEIDSLLSRVAVRWCRDVWSDGFSGGYFWYSPDPVDNIFGVNASAMFLGSIAQLLHERPHAVTADQRRLIQDRADRLARAIVATAELQDGQPFWLYAPWPNKFKHKRPNDLVHHVYTVWGIETYRNCGGKVRLTWSRDKAVASVDRFWQDGKIIVFPRELPADKNSAGRAAPARLWSAGMMLACYGRWGATDQAAKTLRAIERDYGPWPRLAWYPRGGSRGDFIFPRHAAHVLYGLAWYAYPINLLTPRSGKGQGPNLDTGWRMEGPGQVATALPQPTSRDGFYRDLFVLAYPLKAVRPQEGPQNGNQPAGTAGRPMQNWELKAFHRALHSSAPDTSLLLTDFAARPNEEATPPLG